MEEWIITANQDDAGERIDRFLANRLSGVTRSALTKLFAGGGILVNAGPVSKSYKLMAGDTVAVTPRDTPAHVPRPENIPLDIVYEDEYLLVVNKPKGMLAHPVSDEKGTLVNALLYHCGGALSAVGGALRPGIVHRIDKDTSGLLVAAKTDAVHSALAKQAEEHAMLRAYEGVVYGDLKDNSGVVDAPIGRHPVNRVKRCVREGARRAVTHYRVIARYNGFSHLELRLETGRTHQIRVHMAHIGHPVAGDTVYGPPKAVKSLNGQCLHARTLGFIHPVTGEQLLFTSELPDYFTGFLSKIIQGE